MEDIKKFEQEISNELSTRQRIVMNALMHLNYPASSYIGPEKGCDPEDGLDCSGFVKYILLKSGIVFNPYWTFSTSGEQEMREVRHANEFFDKFGQYVDNRLIKPGDLVFFSRKGQTINHIGIVINKVWMIHSPGISGKKICLRKMNELENYPLEIPLKYQDQIFLRNPVLFKRPTMFYSGENNERWREVPIT